MKQTECQSQLQYLSLDINEFAALFLYPMYFPPPLIQWGMLSWVSLNPPPPHPGTNYLLWSIETNTYNPLPFYFCTHLSNISYVHTPSPNNTISLSPTIGFLAPHYPSYPTLQPISASIEKLISSSNTQMFSLLHFTPFGHPLLLDLPAPLPPNQAELPSPVAVSLPTVPLEISPPATIMHALLCPWPHHITIQTSGRTALYHFRAQLYPSQRQPNPNYW